MSTATLGSARLAKHRRRKLVNVVALTLSLAAMAFGVFWLIWILFETVRLGVGGLSLATFTEMTPAPQAEIGGLGNAIFGSALMVALATLIGTPIGVLAGIYLADCNLKRFIHIPFAYLPYLRWHSGAEQPCALTIGCIL